MELTKKQSQGLDTILQRYKNHKKYIVVAGYASLDKTNLVELDKFYPCHFDI